MNVERMKLLYEALSGVPALLVTPYQWRTKIGADGFLQHHDVLDTDLWDATEDLLKGTSAHPFTWASLHPELRAQGLHTGAAVKAGEKIRLLPAYGNFVGYVAIMDFFDLTAKEFQLLMDPIPKAFHPSVQRNYKQWFLTAVVLHLVNEDAIPGERFIELLNQNLIK